MVAETIKPGYKQTEIGIIPEDWDAQKLNYLTDVRDGTHDSPKYCDKGVLFITSKNIINGELDFTEIKYISKEDAVKINERSKVDREDIIMSMIGTIGNAVLIDFEPDFCIKNVALFKPNTKRIDPKFLIQLIYSSYYQEYMIKQVAGGIQKFLSLTILRNLLVPFPKDPKEQSAIAQTLSETDDLIQKLDKLIFKKKDIKKGAMQKLLTGKKRLPGFSREWEEISFDDAFHFLSTASYSRSELSDNREILYVHYGDIHTKWDHYLDIQNSNLPSISKDKLKSYSLLKEGDLIIVDASEDYEGICKSVEIKNIGNKKIISGLHTFLLRSKENIFSDGFKGYICSNVIVRKQFNRLATGLKVYGVSKTNLRNVLIPLPDPKEQSAIAKVLSDMDTEIKELEAKRNKYQKIKQGMMQQLLTGRIRLKCKK